MDKKALQDLNLSSIEDYFSMICVMDIHGMNITEAVERLTEKQFDSFFVWLQNEDYPNAHDLINMYAVKHVAY